jgi:hypothetical protein
LELSKGTKKEHRWKWRYNMHAVLTSRLYIFLLRFKLNVGDLKWQQLLKFDFIVNKTTISICSGCCPLLMSYFLETVKKMSKQLAHLGKVFKQKLKCNKKMYNLDVKTACMLYLHFHLCSFFVPLLSSKPSSTTGLFLFQISTIVVILNHPHLIWITFDIIFMFHIFIILKSFNRKSYLKIDDKL